MTDVSGAHDDGGSASGFEWQTARVAGRLEGDGLATAPARVARDGVGAKVALARNEVEEGLGEGVVLAVGADEARGVVG